MRGVLLFAALGCAVFADTDSPTGNRTTPPTINSIAPRGVARGTTVEMTVEGLNLARARAIYFSEPGVKGRILRVKEMPDLPDIRLGSNGTPSTIDLGPLPPRNQVTVELDVSPEANIGLVNFRLATPLGASPEGSFLIEPYYGETADKEPNDTPDDAIETFLPTILVGAISRPGDVDYYKIEVKAGEQLVLEDPAAMVGSSLQPVISILSPDLSVVREFGAEGRAETGFAHKFDKAGTYYIKIADYQESGRASHTYRIKLGQFPLATGVYPLGLVKGKSRDVSLKGYRLGSGKLTVKGEPSPEDENLVIVRPGTPSGKSFSQVTLALGDEPEVESAAANTSVAAAQQVAVPVTINGRIAQKGGNYFRFHAAKEQPLVLEVNARRLGSELDSLVEVLDAKGNRIERDTVRAVLETSTTLSERDSVQRGIRINSWSGFKVGDYVMIGGEILRTEALPRTPDDDIVFEAFGGQRLAFFDTSTESHAVDKPVYKVQVYLPGAQFGPNGLPLVRLYYQNDDGGPGYGKDSLLHFAAPADGDYVARIRDVRGLAGEDYAYRLTIRSPKPDFRLSVNPRAVNVPVGGAVPVTATAFRMDGFDGTIDVALDDLPPGLHATKGRIAPGQVATTLLVSTDANAALDHAVPLKVAGHASAGGRAIAHYANPEDKLKLIALMPKPDVIMTADTKLVEVEPGGSAEVSVHIRRQNDFGGRVPVEVRNLPPRVRVLDVGLNGVLINETEDRRSFRIEALPSADPIEQWIYVAANVETRSNLPTSYAAPEPILLRVRAKTLTRK